jgi:hypothetical protein
MVSTCHMYILHQNAKRHCLRSWIYLWVYGLLSHVCNYCWQCLTSCSVECGFRFLSVQKIWPIKRQIKVVCYILMIMCSLLPLTVWEAIERISTCHRISLWVFYQDLPLWSSLFNFECLFRWLCGLICSIVTLCTSLFCIFFLPPIYSKLKCEHFGNLVIEDWPFPLRFKIILPLLCFNLLPYYVIFSLLLVYL